jgi:hypothetical protein
LTKKSLATFWAILTQTHFVTLPPGQTSGFIFFFFSEKKPDEL